jgi:hypothetical protein
VPNIFGLYCERVKFRLFYLPQPTFVAVALNIISLRSLLRFNPIGVGGVFFFRSPGFTWGYYLAPLVTTFHFQPLSGLNFRDKIFSWQHILNAVITWISWGVAPGYINIAPLGLRDSYLSYERVLKKSNLFPS